MSECPCDVLRTLQNAAVSPQRTTTVTTYLCEGRPRLSLAHPRLYRLDYTRDGEEAFLADTKTQDAVIRNLEIIGEAVKNISGELKHAYSDIPWQRSSSDFERP